MLSINLNREVNGGGGGGGGSSGSSRPQKRALFHSEDEVSGCISRLESKGIPRSLCALVRNLLDCGDGDFRGDETYTSFADLELDLELMIEDPSRFLDDIPTYPPPSLEISDRLYGRELEVAKIERAYRMHLGGERSGAIVSGGAGVGKSDLGMRVVKKLTNRLDGYLLAAKFDQNRDVNPLSVIGNMFDSLCDLFARDASPAQKESVGEELESALGSQASLLASAVPSLSKLLPSCIRLEPSSDCIDSALSMRFLFGELLGVISSHSSRPMSLFLDDIQWSEDALLVLGNLISKRRSRSKPVFFVLCYRDDEVGKNGPFDEWLGSIGTLQLEAIKVENMNADSVNDLLSDALHLSPRITRPLAAILHRKTRGNPLFLRQLLDSLKGRNCIYFRMSPPRWSWDLNKIMELKISEDVVNLLVEEMQGMPSDLQLGLQTASCLGSRVKVAVLDILSDDLKVDLSSILQQVTNRGFMNNDGSAMFSFSHDKIEQAAYKLMSEQQRREKHMRIGLALCQHTLSNSADNDELFFSAVNQVNQGGAGVIYDPGQKSVIASLNLKAGKRAVELSDYKTAFKLFEHGASFLGSDHWTTQYSLSVSLFEAAAETASVLNKSEAVNLFSDQLVAHAKCFDDKLNCLCAVAEAQRRAELLKDSMESTIKILLQLGEELPRDMGDVKLSHDMQVMNHVLSNTPDNSIFNMQQTDDKKIVTLLKLHANLAHVLHFIKPSLICAVSLRMVALTVKMGMSSMSPLAFTYYGEMLIVTGNLALGCRLGRLALKLCERKNSSRYKSSVICFVHQSIFWASEPLQSIAEAHLLGQKMGQQSGDILFATLNWNLAITTGYVAGQRLDQVRENARGYIQEFRNKSKAPLIENLYLLYVQTVILNEGPQVADQSLVDDLPGESEILANAGPRKGTVLLLVTRIHRLIRAILFCQIVDVSLHVNISELMDDKHSLRPLNTIGIFYEGIGSFLLARHTNGTAEWVKRGDTVLSKIKFWAEHSRWNWENKEMLLEAEKMHTLGNFNEASSFYDRSIRSAHEHKFIQEEAIASELAGIFYCERGLQDKSACLLMHSVRCYEKWGALAVANRVKATIASKYGSDFMQLEQSRVLECILAPGDGSTKKRHARE